MTRRLPCPDCLPSLNPSIYISHFRIDLLHFLYHITSFIPRNLPYVRRFFLAAAAGDFSPCGGHTKNRCDEKNGRDYFTLSRLGDF